MQPAPAPTAAQQAWLKDHPDYVRMGHSLHSRFAKRGTLLEDGTFVPEAPGRPIADGAGSFGVGLPR